MTTYREAKNDILELFKDAWDPTGYVAQYTNVAEEKAPPDVDEPWARATVGFTNGDARSIGGISGKARYENTGTLTIQIFTPVGDGGVRAYDLGQQLVDAYRGASTENGVTFTSVGMREAGVDGSWFQVNVTATFTYDRVQ